MAKLCRGRRRNGANTSDGTAGDRWRLMRNKMLGMMRGLCRRKSRQGGLSRVSTMMQNKVNDNPTRSICVTSSGGSTYRATRHENERR
jgi:hypothetical protein